MKLEHVALNVSHPREAASWYETHLGLEVVKRFEEPPYIHFLSDGQGGMIELYSNPAGDVPHYADMSPYTLHLAFRVDDIAATHEALLEAGAAPLGPVETTAAGDLLAFLRDPWGVTIQLVRRKEGRLG